MSNTAISEAITFPMKSMNHAMYDMTRKILEFHAYNAKTEATREKFKAGYRKFVGANLKIQNLKNPEHVVVPPVLWGPPGGGKTSCAVEAIKLACDYAGMIFKLDPLPGDPITENDYVMVRATFVEAESPHTAIGIPVSEEFVGPDGKKKFMTFLKEGVYTRMLDGGAAFLFIDDLPSAAPAIQNFLLRAFYHPSGRQLGDMRIPNTFVAGAGNLGDLDGTHTYNISQALYGRSSNLFVDDNPADFVARIRAGLWDNEFGVAHFDSFISMYPQFLRTEDDAGKFEELTGPRPSPRAVESAIRESISLMNLYSKNKEPSLFDTGYSDGKPNMIEHISSEVAAKVGKAFAEKYIAHFADMNSGIYNMVENLLKNGKLQGKELADFKEHCSDPAGRNSSKQYFQQRLAYGLAQACYNRLMQKPDDKAHVEKTLGLLTEGLLGPGTKGDGIGRTNMSIGMTAFYELVKASGHPAFVAGGSVDKKFSSAHRNSLSIDFSDRIGKATSDWLKAHPGLHDPATIRTVLVAAVDSKEGAAHYAEKLKESLDKKIKGGLEDVVEPVQLPGAGAAAP